MNHKLDLSFLAYGLALFSGVSYLWGFWLNFDVNILSYAALTDVIKASVYPALPALAVLAMYSALDGANAMSKDLVEEYNERGGTFKRYTLVLKGWFFFSVAAVFGNAVYLILTNNGYFRLLGIYPLASMALFIYLVHNNKFLMSFPVKPRVFILTLVCFLPTYLFNKGYSNGQIVLNHEAVGHYVIAEGYCSSDESTTYRFISVIGNRLFTLSSDDESICVRSAENFRLVKYNIANKESVLSEIFDNFFGRDH